MRIFLWGLCCWALSAAAPVHAQSLAMSAYVQQVEQAAVSLLLAEQNTRVAEGLAAASGRWADPQLSVGLAPESVAVPGLDTGAVVGLSQALPWPQTLRSERARAQAQLVEQQAVQLQQELMLQMQARQAYAQWWYVHQAIAANAEQQQLLADLLQAARGAYGSGATMSQARLLRLGLRLTQREQQALDLEAQRKALAGYMNALRNQAVDHPLPPPSGLPKLPALPATEQLRAALVHAHPQLAGLQARMEAAEHAQDLARWNYRPDFRLQLQYLQTLPREENRTQVGLSFNVPLGQEKRDGALRAARAKRYAAELAQEDALNQLQAELSAVLAQERAAERSVTLLRSSALPLAEDALQAARAAFMSGQGDLQAVLDAEADRIEVVLDLARSRAQHCQQRFALAQLTAGRWEDQLWNEGSEEGRP